MFFERHEGGERALLVHLDGQDSAAREDPQEFQELAISAGADTVAFFNVPSNRLTAKYLIGSGKVEELRDQVKATEADLVIFNHVLTPSQERNLERVFECRVLDRTGLILDIFAQRARTHEGKLQVELAQLDHLSTRLVRGWTHLERQKGGIGLRGPGETQLETDRRLLRVRIRQIKQKLEKVRSQREQARRGRRRADIPSVSLVGYTNAGKSTLITAVSNARPKIADYPFTTLHPNLGVVRVGENQSFVIADIPGLIEGASEGAGLGHQFLRHLARTTILLHLVDIAPFDPSVNPVDEARAIVNELKKYDELLYQKPRWLILNKIDMVEDVADKVKAFVKSFGWAGPVYSISAIKGVGCKELTYDIMTFIEENKKIQDEIVISE